MLTLSRRRLGLAMLGALVLFSTSFARAQEQQAASGTLKIGFLMDSLKIERWQTESRQVPETCHGIRRTSAGGNGEGDDELQLQQAQKLLAAGVKALVLVPHDADKRFALSMRRKPRSAAALLRASGPGPGRQFLYWVDGFAVGSCRHLLSPNGPPRATT